MYSVSESQSNEYRTLERPSQHRISSHIFGRRPGEWLNRSRTSTNCPTRPCTGSNALPMKPYCHKPQFDWSLDFWKALNSNEKHPDLTILLYRDRNVKVSPMGQTKVSGHSHALRPSEFFAIHHSTASKSTLEADNSRVRADLQKPLYCDRINTLLIRRSAAADSFIERYDETLMRSIRRMFVDRYNAHRVQFAESSW